jgi:hypothetical protein
LAGSSIAVCVMRTRSDHPYIATIGGRGTREVDIHGSYGPRIGAELGARAEGRL